MFKLPSILSLKTTAIVAAIALTAGFGLGWYEKTLRVPKLLEAQKTADVAACKVQQDLTKEKNDELVKDRDRIARDAANYKRLHPNTCLYVTGAGQLQPAPGQHAGVYGVSTDWLRDYAAVCETLRSELAVCSGRSISE